MTQQDDQQPGQARVPALLPCQLSHLQRVALSGYGGVATGRTAIDKSVVRDAVVRMLSDHMREILDIGTVVAEMLDERIGKTRIVPLTRAADFKGLPQLVSFGQCFPAIWELMPDPLRYCHLTNLQRVFPY